MCVNTYVDISCPSVRISVAHFRTTVTVRLKLLLKPVALKMAHSCPCVAIWSTSGHRNCCAYGRP